ncbi:hypothetical protein KIN20_033807 [Parelaphostrongylus tenuis]|uniref:Uncharacterized protein n=1 Tax=Parelaphostrongylus tenuis TaxID=148309 RepID=A0AAD5WJ65_PARTN|nr:hypothetical protein KIN20_033807 [Parelaphostrongylus tenuis]
MKIKKWWTTFRRGHVEQIINTHHTLRDARRLIVHYPNSGATLVVTVHITTILFFMPPGMIPLRCVPGQNKLLPFSAFLSPPHFLWSPPEVRENTIGLHPEAEKHEPAVSDIQPGNASTCEFLYSVVLGWHPCSSTRLRSRLHLFQHE